jgi:hypothetical protein
VNREHVSVQEKNPTRTVLGDSGSQTDSEDNMSETVWILGPTKSRPPRKLRYHTSPDCPVPRMYTAEAIERQEAESRGYTRCRRNGPCNSATKAGPRPGRNREMVTAGKSSAHGLQVLLRRRPRTISRQSAAFHAREH